MDMQECIICMESVDNSNRIITKCNHTFHFSCLKTWLSKNDSCPMCRHFLPLFMEDYKITTQFFQYMIDNDDRIHQVLPYIDVNHIDSDGFTYLLTICSLDIHPTYIQLLLDHGADPEIQDFNGNTALMRSISSNKTDFFDLFMNWGVDIYKKNNHGYDAIYYAVQSKNIHMVISLLQNDMNLIFNTYDEDHFTLLHVATLMGCMELVQLFLTYIDSNTLNDNNVSPLTIATAYGFTDIITLLIDSGSHIRLTELNLARRRNFIDIIKLFIQSKLDVTDSELLECMEDYVPNE